MATREKIEEKVDVVIAGAGASGSTFAAVLAKAGKKVVLIDNGPDWQGWVSAYNKRQQYSWGLLHGLWENPPRR